MEDIQRTTNGKQIFIGAPDGLSKKQYIAILDEVEANIGTSFTGTYAEAQTVIRKKAIASQQEKNPGSALAAKEPSKVPTTLLERDDPSWSRDINSLGNTKNKTSVTTEADELLANAPKNNWQGYTDEFIRQAGPTAAAIGAGTAAGFASGSPDAAAIGAGLAASERIWDATSPAILNVINKQFGTNLSDWPELKTAFFDMLRLDKADTPSELAVGAMSRGLADTAIPLGLGKMASAKGAIPLAQGTRTQEAMKVLSEAPATQIAGEVASGYGAQTGANIAEKNNYGPIATTLMTLGGAILGDLTGTQLEGLVQQTKRLMTAKNMDLPKAAQETLDNFQNKGKLLLSDMEVKTPEGKVFKDFREVHGTNDLRFTRAKQRVNQVNNMLDNFDAVPGNYYSEDIAKDFVTRHNTELTKATKLRDEVVDKMSKVPDEYNIDLGSVTPGRGTVSGPMPTPTKGIANVDTSDAKEAIARLGEEISTSKDGDLMLLVNKLDNWSKMLEGTDFAQTLKTKKAIGGLWADDAYSMFKDQYQGEINDIYMALADDLSDHVAKYGDISDVNKWGLANKQLSDLSDEFGISNLKEILTEGINDETVVQQMLYGTSKKQFKTLYDGLSPEGQTRATAAVMAKAAEGATTNGVLSPNTYSDNLQKEMVKLGVTLDPEYMKSIDGTLEWLNLTASDELIPAMQALNPGKSLPGGQYAFARLLFSTPGIGIPVAGAMAITPKKLVKALEQDDLRDLMIKLSEVPLKPQTYLTRQRMSKRISEIIAGYAQADSSMLAEQNRSKAATRGFTIEEDVTQEAPPYRGFTQ